MRGFGFAIMALGTAFVAGPAAAADRPSAKPAPVGVIFDTDLYSDIDDMLALPMLHAFEDRGEAKLLAVTIGTEARWIAPYVDAIDTFYGRGGIPIGMVRGGITPQRFKEKPFGGPAPYSPNGINYTQYIAELTDKNGSLVYPHRLIDGAKAEEVVGLLRRVLAAQPDRSVVMIQVGYSTNFARLLDSKPDRASPLDGRALIKRKVRMLSAMAGNFGETEMGGKKLPAGLPEFNLMLDVPAAQKVFSEWPTPIVASGFEIGLQMCFPQSAIDRDFNYVEHHPIAETYRYVAPYYSKGSGNPDAPHDHETFDLTSVLYAIRPEHGYFALSKPGRITILADGGSRFEEIEDGPHRILVLTDKQKERALEAMVMLVSQPPVKGTRPEK